MSFTFEQAAAAAKAAGFSDDDSITAAAIAMAESGGNEAAVSKPNSNGTVDKGAWQINSSHTAILATGDPLSLADNAQMAHAVFAGQGWKAWTTYNTGAYKKFLPDAKSRPSILQWLTNPVGSAGATVAQGVQDASGLGGLAGAVTKAASDMATVVIAVVLVGLGFFILVRNTAPAKAVTSTAVTAAKVAALA